MQQKEDILRSVETSRITFQQYHIPSTVKPTESSKLMKNYCGIADANEETPSQIAEIIEAQKHRVSLLLETLESARRDAVNVLNVSLDWRDEFPKSEFNNMLTSLRGQFVGLRQQGCICVIAAGNRDINLDDDYIAASTENDRITSSLLITIANEEEFRENMIVVGASGIFGQYCTFSNYGAKSVHFTAPGENVLLAGGEVVDGTSYSTALVSALIAVLLQVFPQLKDKTSAVISRIVMTLDPLTIIDQSDCLTPSKADGMTSFIDDSSSSHQNSPLSTKKGNSPCRHLGRINPSRALRQDFTGRFGFGNDGSLQKGSEELISAFEANIQQAEVLEKESIRLRDQALISGASWTTMKSTLEEEVKLYELLDKQIQSIVIYGDSCNSWKRFELSRISKVCISKKLALSQWTKHLDSEHPHSQLFEILQIMNVFKPSRKPAVSPFTNVLLKDCEAVLEQTKVVCSSFTAISPSQLFWHYVAHILFRFQEEIFTKIVMK